MHSGNTLLFDFMVKGGPLVYPLVICSIFTIAISFERLFHYLRAGKGSDRPELIHAMIEKGDCEQTLTFARKDPRVPLLPKALLIMVVVYALSPIDLIPDFIPVLGFLDDLILLPLGIALVIKMIPKDVWSECQIQANCELKQ
jgi:uncharacterized membrane protein YkvA (DUF1232 family)